MNEILFHIDGFGGTTLNSIIYFFSKFGDIYSKHGFAFTFGTGLMILFGFVVYKLLAGQMTADELVSKTFWKSGSLTDNILIRSLTFIMVYAILLSPMPVVQLTPVVKEDSVTKEMTLLGYTISKRKTIVDAENHVAYIPFVVGYPLKLIEQAVYSIPDFPTDDILNVDNSESSGLLSANLGTFNDSYQYLLENCVSGTTNDMQGYFTAEDLEGSDCYMNISESGIFAKNPKISGEIFSDYFAPLVKINDIVNSNISFLDNAYFKTAQYDLTEAVSMSTRTLDLTDDTIAKNKEIAENNAADALKNQTNEILTKIRKNADKVRQLQAAFQNDQLFSGFFKGYINNLTLGSSIDYIIMDPGINITDSTELDSFNSKRNEVYNKYKDDNLKVQAYYNAEIDGLNPDEVSNDRLFLYSSVNPNYDYSFNNNKIVLDISGISDNKVLSFNSNLVSNVEATFLVNLKSLIESVEFKPEDGKHYDKEAIKAILDKTTLSATDKDNVFKTLDELSAFEAKFAYHYVLDLITDLTDQREKEINAFIETYVPKYRQEIDDGIFTEDLIKDKKESILIAFKKDLMLSSKPLFGYLVDGYSTVKRDPNDSTKFIEDESENPPYRMLKKIDYDTDDFVSLIYDKAQNKYVKEPITINKEYIDLDNLTGDYGLLTNLNKSFTSKLDSEPELKENFSMFNSVKNLVAEITKERKLRTYKKSFSGKKVFCIKKYSDAVKQSEFCQAINDKIDSISKETPETDSINFTIKEAIMFTTSEYMFNTFAGNNNIQYFEELLKKLSDFKLFLSGLLVMTEQSEYEDFSFEYSILEYGQNILSTDTGELLVDKDIVDEISKQYETDKTDENLQKLMEINYVNKNSYFKSSFTDAEKEAAKTAYLSNLDNINSLLSSNTLEEQLGAITSYIGYKTAITKSSSLPEYLSSGGISNDLVNNLYSGDLGKSTIFKPTVFNYAYSFADSFIMKPIRNLQNVIVTRAPGSKFFTNQLLDVELLTGPIDSIVVDPDADKEEVEIEGAESNTWFKVSEATLSTIVEAITVVILFVYIFYFVVIMAMAVLLNTLGLGYSIVYITYVFLLKSLFSGFDNGELPDFLNKSYMDIAATGLKFLLSWTFFFLVVFLLLEIYNNVIIPIQDMLTLHVFLNMAESGVTTANLLYLYGNVIVVPLALYLFIVAFMVKQIADFFFKSLFVDNANFMREMKSQTHNILKKLRGNY